MTETDPSALAVDRLRCALLDIYQSHVPDQPATSQADEATWVMQHVSRLRKIAADAIDEWNNRRTPVAPFAITDEMVEAGAKALRIAEGRWGYGVAAMPPAIATYVRILTAEGMESEMQAIALKSARAALTAALSLQPQARALSVVLQCARIVVAQDTGDAWTDDHGWVRPIKPETVNALQTALEALSFPQPRAREKARDAVIDEAIAYRHLWDDEGVEVAGQRIRLFASIEALAEIERETGR